ncbi:hypothetical protein GEMRC1_014130 [Eukaryota sp. GEM-RC1]
MSDFSLPSNFGSFFSEGISIPSTLKSNLPPRWTNPKNFTIGAACDAVSAVVERENQNYRPQSETEKLGKDCLAFFSGEARLAMVSTELLMHKNIENRQEWIDRAVNAGYTPAEAESMINKGMAME